MNPTGIEHAAVALLGHLADSAVRAFALGSIAALALFAMRVRSAAVTLAVWTTVLGGAMLMPIISQLAPLAPWSLTIALPPKPGSPIDTSEMRVATPRSNGRIDLGPTLAQSPTLSTAASPLPASSHSAGSVPSWPVVAFVVYLAGFGWLTARMIAGGLITTSVRRRAAVVSDCAVLSQLQSQAARAGLDRAPRLFETIDLAVPATTGTFRSAIVLPSDWRDWSAAKVDAVLTHELSHVARRDALTQRLSLCYRALYWFSPFSWWLHRRLVDLGEQASDDAVLAAGADQVEYAEILLEFFAAIRRAPRLSLWHVAMAGGASAERRVERILHWRRSRTLRLTKVVMPGIVVVLAPVAVIAASAGAILVPTELPAAPQAVVAPYASLPAVVVPRFVPRPAAQIPPRPSEISSSPLPQQQTTSVSAPRLDVGPPGRDDLSTRQMVDFVFDLRTLPDQDLKRAAATASVYVESMWRRADVGLDVFHLGAVHVLSSTIDTVQDFTWNKAVIQQAIASVGDRTGGNGATKEARLTSLTKICDTLAQIKPEPGMFDPKLRREFLRTADGKAVLYFANGVLRNMDAFQDIVDLTRACTRPNIWFFSITGATFFDSPPAAGISPVGVSLEVVPHQAGSPVSLVGSKSTLDYGYAVVSAHNDDPFKAIRSLTLAAIVRPNDSALSTPQIFTSQLSRAAIGPNGTLMISTRLIDGATLGDLAVKGAKAQLGVIDVVFDDGTRWTYDVQSNGNFLRAFQFGVGGGPAAAPLILGLPTDLPKMYQRALLEGRFDILGRLLAAEEVPAEDPFAANAHRLTEPALRPPQPSQALALGSDRSNPARIVFIDAIIDATGHVLRVRTAKSLDDSPGGIDQRALVLVRETTFTPAHFPSSRFNGESVTVLVRVPVLVYY